MRPFLIATLCIAFLLATTAGLYLVIHGPASEGRSILGGCVGVFVLAAWFDLFDK